MVYWSFNGFSITDEVQGLKLLNPVNASFIQDRFNRSNTALSLREGCYEIPSGVYFDGDFTISAWVKVNIHNNFSRIVEFGNGKENNTIIFGTSWNNTQKPFLQMIKLTVNIQCISNTTIQIGQWYHIVAVLKVTQGYLYINSELKCTKVMFEPNNVIRSQNYIGKSSWQSNKNANADYDEIKIFDRALNQTEIIKEYLA